MIEKEIEKLNLIKEKEKKRQKYNKSSNQK